MVQIDFVKAWLQQRQRGDRGASLVEYALLLALIAVVCIVAIRTLGSNLNDNYDSNKTSIFG